MLSIIWMIFVAWFLGVFGLDDLVINGFSQLFHMEIGITSYYFIFAIAGLIKNILHTFNKDTISTEDIKKLLD